MVKNVPTLKTELQNILIKCFLWNTRLGQKREDQKVVGYDTSCSRQQSNFKIISLIIQI